MSIFFSPQMFRLLVSGLLVLPLLPLPASTADFTQFIASLWPEAQAAGVRSTFDAETRGLVSDYKLPDLILLT